MRGRSLLLAFNRGIVDPRALARVDLKRTSLSAEVQHNWVPRTLGAMMLRPGSWHLGATKDNGATKLIPFVFSTDDTALVEFTAQSMRVWVDDQVISRPAVGTTISNGEFDTSTGWTDSDESGATSSFGTGYLALLGTGENYAIRDQQVTVAPADDGTEHGLDIYISRGLVEVSVGTTQGATDYLFATLRPGYYNLAFTPAGTFWVRLASRTTYTSRVDRCAISAQGDMVVATPWGSGNLSGIRHEQSGDVIFCANSVDRQRRIERWGPRSWGVAEYIPEDGPFRPINTTPTTLTPSATSGDITVTASRDVFDDGHVGALFKIGSLGQLVTRTITGDNQWTGPIRVTGIDSGRKFVVTVANKSDASVVTLQRSVGAPGDWTEVKTYTANTSVTYDDTLDNQEIYYRIGVDTGDWVSDTFDVSLDFAAGSIEGVVLARSVTDARTMSGSVLTDLGGTDATADWWEGQWSDYRSWPSAVALHDGRLFWAGGGKINGSVSDAYSSFDEGVEGDAGPISRSIGRGPVDDIMWLASADQLLVGTEGSELAARSSSIDEPLTPTAFSLKPVSTRGSSGVQAVQVDTSVLFVQRNGRRVVEAALSDSSYKYEAGDLTVLAPEIGSPGISRLAVQRQPDVRVHCVRADGTVAILVYDRAEQVNCWATYSAGGGGVVVDVAVLPGDDEDVVYYVVQRTVGGATVHHLERWATEAEGQGAAVTCLSDGSLSVASSGTVLAGLSHLEGLTVCAWGESRDLGEHTVSAGQVVLPENVTGDVVVGLPYTGRFKSARFGLESKSEVVTLTDPKQVVGLGLILQNTHHQGLRYGQSFDLMDDLPLREGYATVEEGEVYDAYEEQAFPVPGEWTSDARLCLEAASPRPCTVVAAVVTLAGHAK